MASCGRLSTGLDANGVHFRNLDDLPDCNLRRLHFLQPDGTV